MNCKQKELRKKYLTACICCALTLGVPSPYYNSCLAAEIGDTVTVEKNTAKETIGSSNGTCSDYYSPTYSEVNIKEGGRWRPFDAIAFLSNPYSPDWYINIGKLNMEKGGIVDLSYYEVRNPFKYSDPDTGETDYYGHSLNRHRSIQASDVTLADGTIFRVNGSANYRVGTKYITNDFVSSIILGDLWNGKLVNGSGTVYAQLGYIDNFDPAKINRDNKILSGGTIKIAEKSAGQFKIVGQASFMDSPLNTYKVTPIVEVNEQQTTAFDPISGAFIPCYDLSGSIIDYTFDNTHLLSENAKTASDMQLSMRNLWRVENANAFNHLDDIHKLGNKAPEGIWTNFYGGKLSNTNYGRTISENYHGRQLGYDKVRPDDLYNGKLYTGFFFQENKANIGLNSGKGNAKSLGFGTYASWVNNNDGRYLDFMLRGSKLNNDYLIHTNGDAKVTGDNDAWAFGVNTRYGIHKPLANGWYLETQAGLAFGKIDDAGYTTSNGLEIAQSKVNVLTGNIGILVGKELAEAKGNIYAKASLNHDFLNSGSMVGKYTEGTQAIETAANRNTWCELSLGGDIKISPTGNFNLNVLHTLGGDSKTDWQVNGGLNWKWDGFKAHNKEPKSIAVTTSAAVSGANKETASINEAKPREQATTIAASNVANEQVIAEWKPDVSVDNKVNTSQEMQVVAHSEGLGQLASDTPVAAQTSSQDSIPTYAMELVVVQAKRPDWEEKLSPGTVTVIEPDKYKGENKTLPELLKEVPGVHVRYLNGAGQYTTVSVRGSTAAQVGVFVDGVLANLGGDAAVDISTIPVKNIARIEVYRGYVPARFGGTYMGGVINVVTKKPEKAEVTASIGNSSWGGKKGSIEVDSPLKDGTLMVTLNRDQSDGNFRYTNPDTFEGYADILARAENSFKYCQDEVANGNMTVNNEYYQRAKRELDYLKNLTDKRYRMNNSYKNTDGLIKWQNDHWLFKGSWKKIDRMLPNVVAGIAATDDPSYDIAHPATDFSNIHNRRRHQELNAKDLLIGRRDQSGNLEWGWSVNYLDQTKKYTDDLCRSQALRPLSKWSSFDSNRLGISLDGTFKAGNHMLDFLLNTSKEKMNIDGWKMADLPATSSHQWKNKYEQTLFNIQLQDTVTLNDKEDLWFTPSIRYNSSDILGKSRCIDDSHRWLKNDEGQKDGQTTWQLAVKKKVDDNLTLRSSYGSYYRLLNLYEIAGDGCFILPRPNTSSAPANGSIYPKPEEGMQWDMGASWQGDLFKAKANVNLTYFRRTSENLLQLQRYGLDYMCYDNSAKGKVNGIELQSNFNWNKWDMNLAATHLKAQRSVAYNGWNGNGTWLESKMTYTPEWEGNLRITYHPTSAFDIFTEVNYTGEQYYNDASNSNESYIQKALTTVGLGCKYKFAPNAQFIFGVNDLFDKGPYVKKVHSSGGGIKETLADYPMQGRTYYATLHYDI